MNKPDLTNYCDCMSFSFHVIFIDPACSIASNFLDEGQLKSGRRISVKSGGRISSRRDGMIAGWHLWRTFFRCSRKRHWVSLKYSWNDFSHWTQLGQNRTSSQLPELVQLFFESPRFAHQRRSHRNEKHLKHLLSSFFSFFGLLFRFFHLVFFRKIIFFRMEVEYQYNLSIYLEKSVYLFFSRMINLMQVKNSTPYRKCIE